MRPCNTGLGEEQASEWKRDESQTEMMNACDALSLLSLVSSLHVCDLSYMRVKVVSAFSNSVSCQDAAENCVIWNFVICTVYLLVVGR